MLDGRPIEEWVPRAEGIARRASNRYNIPFEQARDDAVMALAKLSVSTRPRNHRVETHLVWKIKRGVQRYAEHTRAIGTAEVVSLDEDDSVRQLPSLDLSAPELAWHKELWGMVASLPQQQARAIAMHYRWGFTHVEIAQQMGVTPRVVQSAIEHGRKRLRSMMSPVVLESE